jgi:hypothetical protein
MADTDTIVAAGPHLRHAIRAAQVDPAPYRHWLLTDTLPAPLCREIVDLPFTPADIDDTYGKRETHNGSRLFCSVENRARYSACATLAEQFQARATTDLLQDTCGLSLAGAYLRIEYCLDTDGFWLEPHTDIGAKLFTMLIYLSTAPDAVNWGTDVLDAEHRLVGRASGAFNTGLIFLPAADTWHGFAKRPIDGLRRSLIVNYVRPEWRARHELAFPDLPIGAAG